MIFRNLSMAGFKSFADKAELEIETGLTGVVGPNGCGKSNIVEGLRFIMGESSARQMRGAELDDIIFAGTENRPSRNLAEITLTLDNHLKKAPAEYNQFDELEISRKVERGKGSQFQINGRPARARDIQLLFADSATGARSAGMVSQGRIGAIVGAKPEDRRSLIEEAANIKGLHQRRHEAELRLRNTQTNLERLEDVIAQLAEQRNQLTRQARQAARYRSVADRIRKAEAKLALARWQKIEIETQNASLELKTWQKQVEDTTKQTAKAAAIQAEKAASLPPLRQAEAEQAAFVQAMRIELTECDKEAERVNAALQRLDAQISQIVSDASREQALHEDAQKAILSLENELKELQQETEQAQPRIKAAQQKREQESQNSQNAERESAEAQTRLNSAQNTQNQLQTRKAALEQRLEHVKSEQEKLHIPALENALKEADAAQAKTAQIVEDLQQELQQAEALLAQAASDKEKTATARSQTDSQYTRLTAEIDALSYLLSETDSASGTPIADSLRVTDNMELALTICLGTDLNLPSGEGAYGYWRTNFENSSQIEPPATGTPLRQFISGADNLAHALSGISVIEDETAALDAQKSLKPGQALVSKNGTLWRWDGLVRKGETNSEAERIKQRQRLSELSEQEHSLKERLAEKNTQLQTADEAYHTATENLRAIQQTMREATGQADQARRNFDTATLSLNAAQTRAKDLDQAVEIAQQDLNAVLAEGLLETDIQSLSELAESLALKAQDARLAFDQSVRAETEISQSVSAAQQRIHTIQHQIADWQTRFQQTSQRQQEMASREQQAKQERESLSEQPGIIEQRKHELADQLDIQEALRQEKGDTLRLAESALAQADQNLRELERELAQNRESLIRAEALNERLDAEKTSLTDRIREKLDCTAEKLAEIAQTDPDQQMAEPLEKLEANVNRLLNERDQIGPVNLRAEVEMAELDERVKTLQAEHDDLSAAIDKLRAAIATLNREGRARLMESFAGVNKYFSELFKTLFGGGHAELQLTGSEDPLEAGLDILASPPGKKLQSLSLLSGGEQALTALAIIFAVFLTNPAPICVLDEVDAPLDDSNVARFCDLLRDIAERTQTRFLIVTHHRMTMARMDRLYGVTMEQKGVSRLVSVDLQTAEGMRDSLIA